MISRHSALIGLFLDACLVTLTLAVPVTASADDFRPFDIPEEADPFGSDGMDATLPEFIEPGPDAPTDTGADIGTAPAAVPVDTGPPILPPTIDAYVDLSFDDSSADDFGFQDTPGGYRFIAGFIVEKWSTGSLSVAPEIGYVRLGIAEESTTTSTNNTPIQGYTNIKTDRRTIDLSTLTFGVRGGFLIAGKVEAFARTGMHFYHIARQAQTTLSYTPLTNPTPIPDDVQPTNSISEVGTDYYISAGLAVKLGTVPSLYAEYGAYSMGSENITTTSIGFLLNF